MTDLPPPVPAPAPAAPPPPPPPAEPASRKRGWFVVLAWVTLIGFGIFTAAITVLAIALPAIAKAPGR